MTRSVITEWDWRFRVAFDPNLGQSVRAAAVELPHRHARCLIESLEAHEQALVLDALLTNLQDHPHLREGHLQAARGRQPTPLPDVLWPLISTRVAAVRETLRPTQQVILDELVDRARASETNLNRQVLVPVYGDAQLDTLVRLAGPPRSWRRSRGRVLTRRETLRQAHRFQASAEDRFAGVLGPGWLPRFDVEVGDSPTGFGEYWPTSLDPTAAHDRLIVHAGPDAARQRTLQATLVHEVCGHGFFYSREREQQPSFLDHGAMNLVEGFATWSEWGIDPQDPERARAERLDLLPTLDMTVPQVIAAVEDWGTRHSYGRAQTTETLLYLLHYPGYHLAYCLGAAWLDQRLTQQTPGEFLAGLDHWGDFHLCW